MFGPFDARQREEILRRYREGASAHNRCMDESARHFSRSKEEAAALAEARRHLVVLEEAWHDYFASLPRLPMGCCPFCDKTLVRSFDRYGLDGLWWRSDAVPDELPSCPHFCVMLGAVSLREGVPESVDFEIHPGPAVPYVVPRLLGYPQMIMVIGRVKMETGHVVYPLSYFAKKRPPPQDLTAAWPRTVYAYTTQLGDHRWRLPDDAWDFELKPWLPAGQIRWCPPDADNATLSSDAPDRCPYVDLPGERQRRVIRNGRVLAMGVPPAGALAGP